MNQTQTLQSIVLGGGCFWCVEAVYQKVDGVQSVVSGYSGGTAETANYKTICSGTTDHAEVIKIEFDPTVVGLEKLLNIFFIVHDPTTLNRQGNDVGRQYRSVAFYRSESDKLAITAAIERAQSDYNDPIVTEVSPLEHFYAAETEHQDFWNQNPNQPFCQLMIPPKIEKLKKALASKSV